MPNIRAALRFSAATFAALLLCVVAFSMLASGATRKFYDDDPLWVEHDTRDAATMKDLEVDDVVDLTLNLFSQLGDPTPNVRAKNVNTVNEVTSSNWLTNREGSR